MPNLVDNVVDWAGPLDELDPETTELTTAVFGLMNDAGAKGLIYKTFSESDLKHHKDNRLMERMIAVAILEVNLHDAGLNYAQELR